MKKWLSKLLILSVISLPTLANALDDRVEIKPLKQISFDEIGLFTKEDGGFDNDIWLGLGADKEFIVELIALSADSADEITNGLLEKLLLTSAIPPKSENEELSIFEAKLKFLASKGGNESIEKLLTKLPENKITDNYNHILITALFLAQKNDDACELSLKYISQSDLFRKASIICHALMGEDSKLNLSKKLYEEDGYKLDDELKTILQQASNNKKSDKWNEILSARFLSEKALYQRQYSFDSKYINETNTSDEYKTKFKEQFDTAIKENNYEQIATLYSVVDALGASIQDRQWQDLIIKANMTKSAKPYTAFAHLFDKATSKNKKGEAILLMALSIDSSNPMPKYLKVKYLKFLRQLDMDELAAKIAELNSL